MKRHKIQTNYSTNCAARMEESDGGEWIRYSDYIKEKELHKCKCHDENNIMVPYELVVKADQILFLVGQHGNAVLDPDLREQMIKIGSELRKIYMNMKGE